MKISIDSRIKEKIPMVALGVIEGMVTVTKHDENLWTEINAESKRIAVSLSLDTIGEVQNIRALRNGYKALDKDPLRYRGSQEALTRRILQGKGLYQINTVVDINNLISIQSMHSVGSYNLGNIVDPVVFRIGNMSESYKGIGKEMINIENLPLFADQNGAFGSPTSDSERAMITLDATHIAMVVISFNSASGLNEAVENAKRLLEKYADGKDIQTRIVE